MTPAGSIPREIVRMTRPALIAAVAGTILMLVVLPFSPAQFFRAYLFAWLFCLGLSLGSMAIVMLTHLVAGEWGWLVRRIGEGAMVNMPLLAILFVPILFGLKYLFPWADEKLVSLDPVMQHRAGYMNATWFTMRFVIYFVIWIGMSAMLRRWSLAHDRTGGVRYLRMAQRLSAPGLVIYVVTMTLASVDLILSRDPHWYSHIIGFVTTVGQALAAMSLITTCCARLPGANRSRATSSPSTSTTWATCC
jgi:hypothetical protein